MKHHSAISRKLYNQTGSAFVLVVLWLGIFLGFLGLVVDIGYLLVVRTELQNAADAAALASARELGNYYEGKVPPVDPTPVLPTLTSTAKSTAQLNYAAAEPVSTVLDTDIVVGWWDATAKNVQTTSPPAGRFVDAVQVTTRRDATANGTISTFIAGVVGVTSTHATATAAAALTSISSVGPGETLPIGLSDWWFSGDDDRCDQPIKFYPANDPAGCAGWNGFFLAHDANTIRDILINMLNCASGEGPCNEDYLPPAIDTNDETKDSLDFTGGDIRTVLKDYFPPLFEYMRENDDDGDPLTWTTIVVVYQSEDCSNPQGDIPILGFAKVKITGYTMNASGTQLDGIDAEVECNYTEYGRGGGGTYGLYGSIPQLVK